MCSNFSHFHFVCTVQKSKKHIYSNDHVLILHCVPDTLHWHRPIRRKQKANYSDKIIQITSIGQEPGRVEYFSIVNREEKRFIDDNTWLFKLVIAMRWRAYCYFLLRFFFIFCWCCWSQSIVGQRALNISTSNWWSEKLCYKVKTPLTSTHFRFFFFIIHSYQLNVFNRIFFCVVWNSDTEREIKDLKEKMRPTMSCDFSQ